GGLREGEGPGIRPGALRREGGGQDGQPRDPPRQGRARRQRPPPPASQRHRPRRWEVRADGEQHQLEERREVPGDAAPRLRAQEQR
ncbi:hypothetical protein LTS01_025747, partial [Friedmanniomyces endolithicus]